MLRITRTCNAEGSALFKLEGRLVDDWVGVLERTCQVGDGPLTLDLSDVSYASSEGFALLQDLQQRGVQCAHWSHFLKELAHHT